MANERTTTVRFVPVSQHRQRRYAFAALLAVLLPLAVWHLLASREVRVGAWRLVQPWAAIQPFSPLALEVLPGEKVVPRGDPVQIVAIPNQPLEHPPVLRLMPVSSTANGTNGADESAGTLTEMYQDDAATYPRFIYTLTGLHETTAYDVRAEKFLSPRYHLTVVPRPEVKTVTVTVKYPEYLEKRDLTLASGQGDTKAPIGSTISLKGESTQPLTAARLRFAMGGPAGGTASTVVPLKINGTSFTGSFGVATTTQYWVELAGRSDLANVAPVKYTITAVEDASPTIAITKPGTDTLFPKEKRLDLRVEGRDDFGVVGMVLYYQIGIRPDWIPLNLKANLAPQPEVTVDYPFMLDTLAVEPGVEVRYYAQVEDGMKPHAQIGTSTIFKLRVPSMVDLMGAADHAENALHEKLQKYQQREKDRLEQVKKNMADLKHQGQLDPKTEKQFEEAIKKGEAQQEEAEQIMKQAQDLEERLKSNQLANPENLEKLAKLNQLLNEVLDTEAKRLMKQLQESLKDVKLDPKDVQKFEENFKMSEYLEQIDRSIEALQQLKDQRQMLEIDQAISDLKRRQQTVASETADLERRKREGNEKLTESEEKKLAELEKKLAEMQKLASEAASLQEKQANGEQLNASESARLDEIARQLEKQQALASEAAALQQKQANAKPDDAQYQQQLKELQDRQKKIGEELAELQKKAAEMAEKLEKEKSDPQAPQKAGKEAMKDLRDRMQQENFAQNQKDIEKNLAEQKLNDAQQGQQRMLKFLEALKKNSERMAQECSQQGQQQQVDLSRFIQRAIQVSVDQEALLDQLDGVPGQFMRGHLPLIEGRVNEVSVRELIVKRAGNSLEDDLESFFRKNINLDAEVLLNIRGTDAVFNTIVKDLEDRAVDRATGAQRDIIRRFNRLAIDLMRAQEQSNQSQQSGQGSMQQMLESFKQMTRRQLQLNQMTQKMQQMSPQDRSMMEQMKRMAQEQRQLREQLEQLMRDARQQRQVLGRMDDVTEDMKDIETRLLEGKYDRKLAEKQKSVYDRMLKAQKSLKQRDDESDERQAKAPEKAMRMLQPTKALADPQANSVDLAKDYMGEGKDEYPQAYEQLLRDYYKSLSLEGATGPTAPAVDNPDTGSGPGSATGSGSAAGGR